MSGLRQCARGRITFPYVNGYILSTRGCFRVYQQLVTSRADQEASVSAGVLDRRTHEPVDELFENHLAGKCLGDFDHGRDIELFDRDIDRGGLTRRPRLVSKPRRSCSSCRTLPCAPQRR